MGVRLIVEVLDNAPTTLTAGERLVLVILAEQARDTTRIALPGEDVLQRRSGGMTDASLRRAIRGLCDAGVVERIPVGTDRNGSPLYACRGRRAEYRILPTTGKAVVSDLLPSVRPEDESRSSQTPSKAVLSDPHWSEKGGPRRTERGSETTGKGVRDEPPIPHNPSDNPQISARDRDTVTAALKARTGRTITDDHATAVVAQILDAASAPVRDRRKYLRGAIDRDPRPDRFLPTPSPPAFVRHA